jgi:hypothetical protein
MANYRKKVRDALVSVLDASGTGFNAQLGAIGSSYEVQPFDLDFGAQSPNVVYGYLDEEEISVSRMFQFPGAVIYTTEAVRENRNKFSPFSGFVVAVMTVYLRLRALDDIDTGANRPDFSNDFEKWADAVDDAVHESLFAGRSLFSAAGVNLTEYRSDRDPVLSTGDGHIQRVNFTFGFEVHL